MSVGRFHLYTALPNELQAEVLLHFAGDSAESAKELARLRVVSKRIDALANDAPFWKKKVCIHFPDAFKRHVNKEDTNWPALFSAEYQEKYKHLTDTQKKLIIALNENDFVAIKKLHLTLKDLIAEINHNGATTPLALCTNNKAILHYLYKQIIFPLYNDNNWSRYYSDRTKNRTLFYWALACGLDRDYIDHLIRFKVTPLDEICFDTNESLLHLAARFGRVDVVKLLIEEHGFLLETLNKNRCNALFPAAEYGKTNVLRYLASAGMDLKTTEPYDLLLLAAAYGRNNTLRFLLANNTNPSTRHDGNGYLAIHYAASSGHLHCVKILVEHSATQLNIPSRDDCSALYYAAANGHEDIVEYLLERGADIYLAANATSKQAGKTAIMRAADFNHAGVIIQLLNAGSDLTALIDYLYSADNAETLAKLVTLDPARFDQTRKDALLLKAVKTGNPKMTATLLSLANTSLQDDNGYSLIHLAALDGHNECLKKIIAHDRSKVEVPFQHIAAQHPDTGKTALFFAHEANNTEGVDIILSNLSDKQLFDALIFALHNQALPIVEKIIQLNPKLTTLRDDQNRTPLMIANELNYTEAVNILFENNVFENAHPGVFQDMESSKKMNDGIAALDNRLKTNYVQDISLMIDTQNVLSTLNSTSVSVDAKSAALETYKQAHHTISIEKYCLCIAALSAIVIATLAACFFAPILITGYVGIGIGIAGLCGITAGSVAGTLAVQLPLLLTNNFFTRTFQQRHIESAAKDVADCAADVIRVKLD